MKKYLLALFLFGSSMAAMAQRSNQCGIIIPPVSLRSDFASVYEAKNYISQMLDRINWQQNFEVREQNGINNAYATIINNQRYIVYDNRFLESIDRYAGTKWASISVLAHEMGHHYYNHMVNGSCSSQANELQADYFSGFVMQKMGATAEEAKAALSLIASPQASSTHPGKADRLNAIQNGWNDGSVNTTGRPSQYPGNSQYPDNSGNSQYPGRQHRRNGQNRNNGQYPNGGQYPNSGQYPNGDNSQTSQQQNDADWIQLSLYGNSNVPVFLSDDGRQFSQVSIKLNEPFVFKYDIYDYGWLKIGNNRNARTYRLYHGKDYAIVWSRRSNDWTLIEVN
jgi:hypothetical protein